MNEEIDDSVITGIPNGVFTIRNVNGDVAVIMNPLIGYRFTYANELDYQLIKSENSIPINDHNETLYLMLWRWHCFSASTRDMDRLLMESKRVDEMNKRVASLDFKIFREDFTSIGKISQ